MTPATPVAGAASAGAIPAPPIRGWTGTRPGDVRTHVRVGPVRPSVLCGGSRVAVAWEPALLSLTDTFQEASP